MTFSPTPEQLDVIESGLHNLRISAGAGTGKTTTLAARIARVIAEGLAEPEEILGITFTNKAVSELASRIRVHIDTLEPGREVEVHTYHGFAARIVSELGPFIGVERQATVITPAYSRQLMSEALFAEPRTNIDLTNSRGVEMLFLLSAELGDALMTPEQFLAKMPDSTDEPWPKRRELTEILVDFARRKRDLGVVDFSDLILLANQITEAHPEAVARLASQYRLVLLDEYQDTNPAQRVLLQALFGGRSSITAVGDPDQTIYEWRGASLENFAAFPEHFPATDGSLSPTLSLTRNRRSRAAIVGAANDIRRELERDPRGDLIGLDEATGGVVTARWEQTALDEAEAIADRMVEAQTEGRHWKDMAVLFRKNKDIPLIRDVLTSRGIPIEVASTGGLLGIPEVADVHAWLRILGRHDDTPALLRVLMGARFRLGLTAVRTLSRLIKGDGEATLIEAFDRLDELETDDATLNVFSEVRDLHRELLSVAQSSSLVEIVRSVLQAAGVWQEIEAMPPESRLSARLNLYRFLDLAEGWSPLEGRPSLPAFLHHLDLLLEDSTEELDTARLSGEDTVILLTVHRAKGLEWPIVFLPALYRSNFPSGVGRYENPNKFADLLPYEFRLDRESLPQLDIDADDNEQKAILAKRHTNQEWRVAYVAVTRAKDEINASGAYWYGVPEPRKTSTRPSPLFELLANRAATKVDIPEKGPRPESLLVPWIGSGAPDPTFEEGWEAGLRLASEQPEALDAIAKRLGSDGPYSVAVDHLQEMLFSLPAPPHVEKDSRVNTSVSGLVTYATCPQRFYWSEVDRLPRRHSAAAKRGVDVHRAIELHNRGVVPLDDSDGSLIDVAPGEGMGGTGALEAFFGSRFAEEKPLFIEAPFELKLGDAAVIRGRIDAVYGNEDAWEVVDYKSGAPGIWASPVQLQAYAVAVSDGALGSQPPEDLTVTFAYLGGGLETHSEHVDQPWLDQATENLQALVTSIAGEEFDPVPSEACHSCDFAHVCPVGTGWLQEHS